MICYNPDSCRQLHSSLRGDRIITESNISRYGFYNTEYLPLNLKNVILGKSFSHLRASIFSSVTFTSIRVNDYYHHLDIIQVRSQYLFQKKLRNSQQTIAIFFFFSILKDWMFMSPQNPYVRAITLNVMIFGNGAFRRKLD